MKTIHVLIILLFSQTANSQKYTQVRYMSNNQTVDEWRRAGDTVFIHDTIYVDSCRIAREAFKRDIVIDSFMVASSKSRFHSPKTKSKMLSVDQSGEFKGEKNNFNLDAGKYFYPIPKTEVKRIYKTSIKYIPYYKPYHVKPKKKVIKKSPLLPTELMIKIKLYLQGKFVKVIYLKTVDQKYYVAMPTRYSGEKPFMPDSARYEIYVPK